MMTKAPRIPLTRLPRYRSYKRIEAFKIRAIVRDPTGLVTLHPVDATLASFTLDSLYVKKHAPQPGGYFIRYEDGYCSWSPAGAFEAGYTRLPDQVEGRPFICSTCHAVWPDEAPGLPSWDPGPTEATRPTPTDST